MANGESETVNLVLAKIGRSPGVGQSVPSEDYSAVKPHIRRVADGLSSEGVVTVPDLTDVPNSYFEQFCTLVACAVAPEFDVPADASIREDAKAQIRKIVAASPTYEVLRAQYF